jgi:hypothetical protein
MEGCNRAKNHLEALLRISLPEEEFNQLLTAAEKERLSQLEFLHRLLRLPARRRRCRLLRRRRRTTDRDRTGFEWLARGHKSRRCRPVAENGKYCMWAAFLDGKPDAIYVDGMSGQVTAVRATANARGAL